MHPHTHSESVGLFVVTRVSRTIMGGRGFNLQAPLLWYSLPACVRDTGVHCAFQLKFYYNLLECLMHFIIRVSYSRFLFCILIVLSKITENFWLNLLLLTIVLLFRYTSFPSCIVNKIRFYRLTKSSSNSIVCDPPLLISPVLWTRISFKILKYKKEKWNLNRTIVSQLWKECCLKKVSVSWESADLESCCWTCEWVLAARLTLSQGCLSWANVNHVWPKHSLLFTFL